MLTYTLDLNILRDLKEKKFEAEKYDEIYDFFAYFLGIILGNFFKKGLYKSYEPESDALSTVKGKININETIKNNQLIKRKLVCDFDEYSSNTFLNQIIKTTIFILLKSSKVNSTFKITLKSYYYLFNDIDIIPDVRCIRWDEIMYNKSNKHYRTIINICYLVLHGLIINDEGGNIELNDHFDNTTLAALFENFVRKYFEIEFASELISKSEKIRWQYDENNSDETLIDLLPLMNTDISLSSRTNNKELIIDTKFYEHIMKDKGRFGIEKKLLNSNHLYQINSYVQNKAFKYLRSNSNIELSGMLLYAKTGEDVLPVSKANIMGHDIYVRVIDLNKEFSEIKMQLNEIASILL